MAAGVACFSVLGVNIILLKTSGLKLRHLWIGRILGFIKLRLNIPCAFLLHPLR